MRLASVAEWLVLSVETGGETLETSSEYSRNIWQFLPVLVCDCVSVCNNNVAENQTVVRFTKPLP